LRLKGNMMTRNSKHDEVDDSRSSDPIRRGSVLYRALEMIAAEIARHLTGNKDTDGRPAIRCAAEDNSTPSDTN